MDTKQRITVFNNRHKAAEDRRLDVLSLMEDIAKYILPSKGLFPSSGDKPDRKTSRFQYIIDDTATRALALLGAGMQGGLTSPSRPWFRILTEDEALMKIERVAEWMNYVERRMYGVFHRSNFYSAIHQFYEEEAAFGTSVIFIQAHPKRLLWFFVLPAGTYSLEANEYGEIDTFFQRIQMTVIQAALKFGEDALRETTRELLKEGKNPYELIEVVHLVEPRKNRNVMKIDALNMPWASIWLEAGRSDAFLRESGFSSKPFAVGRWSINGEEFYGTSPGQRVLGMAKMLQSLQKSSLKAIHKEVDPPMRVPSQFKDTLNQLPGGINYVAANDGKDAIGRLFDMNFDYAGCEAKIEHVQKMIERAFYNDLFFTVINRPEMTATEVLQRHEEQLIMLGPTIERQTTEVLDPIISRVFDIMSSANMIPPPPPELEGQPLKIDYISMLAQAQKMLGLQHMGMYLDIATRVSAIEQGSLVKTDWDKYLDEYALRLGINPEITRSPEETEAIRQQIAQAAAQQQQMEMMAQLPDDIKKLSQAKTGQKSALTDIAEAVSG